jgi:hypothetical protein
VHWCRHIDLLKKSPERDASGNVRDPLRTCFCDKPGLESKIAITDWKSLIDSFKGTYRVDCPARSPKLHKPAARGS